MSQRGPAAFTDSLLRGITWSGLEYTGKTLTSQLFPLQYLHLNISSCIRAELAAVNASIIYLHHLAQHACLPPLTTVLFTDSLSVPPSLLRHTKRPKCPFRVLFNQVYRIWKTLFSNPFKIQFTWLGAPRSKYSHVIGKRKKKKAHQLAESEAPKKGKTQFSPNQ